MVEHNVAGSDPALLAVAWLTTLALGSITPEIVLRAGLKSGGSDRRLLFFQIGGLGVLLGLTWAWPTIAPLRGFVWSLLAIQVGYQLSFAVQESQTWNSLTRGMPGGAAFLAVEMLKTIPTAALALSLVGSGLGLRGVFLVPGDIHAISQPTLITGMMPWTRLGPILAVVIALPLALYVGLTRGSDPALLRKAASLAPLILFGAVVNAFNEEFIFRAVLLARLSPALGPAQSLWLTSVRFGVGHWFGNPSGPIGAALATPCRLVLGEEHPRDERPVLGLGYPRDSGCCDLQLDRNAAIEMIVLFDLTGGYAGSTEQQRRCDRHNSDDQQTTCTHLG